jgi:hypothetical protein
LRDPVIFPVAISSEANKAVVPWSLAIGDGCPPGQR